MAGVEKENYLSILSGKKYRSPKLLHSENICEHESSNETAKNITDEFSGELPETCGNGKQFIGKIDRMEYITLPKL